MLMKRIENIKYTLASTADEARVSTLLFDSEDEAISYYHSKLNAKPYFYVFKITKIEEVEWCGYDVE